MGTTRGKILVYNADSQTCVEWGAGNKLASKKRVSFVKWVSLPASNLEGDQVEPQGEDIYLPKWQDVLVYCSEGSNLSFSYPTGEIIEKFTLRKKVLDVEIGFEFLSAILDDASIMIIPLSKIKPRRSQGLGSKIRSDSAHSLEVLTKSKIPGGRRKTRSNSVNMASPALAHVNRSSTDRSSTPGFAVKLDFEDTYGRCVSQCWFGEDMLVVGFSHGAIIGVSSSHGEFSEEMCRVRYLRRGLQDMVGCDENKQLVSCGDDAFQVFDVKRWSLYSFQRAPEAQGRVDRVVLNKVKNIVGVSTDEGNIFCYQIPLREGTDLENHDHFDHASLLKENISLASITTAYIASSLYIAYAVSTLLNADISDVLASIVS
mmetsp:Transcript_27851/g.44598  ORF Transcript_27851/g.44598 Transcript_27851/m.44598 type:complete len:373 (+) Transcript_27851:203-1321(+)